MTMIQDDHKMIDIPDVGTEPETSPDVEFVDEKVLGGPYMRLVRITPELAAYWLAKNTHNRSVFNGVVREYTLAMKEGRWNFDGDAIQFSKDGVLLNGQHRLLAQVASKATVIVPVWFDLDPMVQLEMDQGRKRSFASNLELRGKKQDAVYLSAITSLLYYWDRGARGQGLTNFQNHNGNRAQMRQLMEYFYEHESEISNSMPAAHSAHKTAFAPLRVTAFANLLFRRIDPADADAFMKSLASGVGLEAENPILLLRQRLVSDFGVKNRIGRPQAWVMLALIIKAWNYWRDGESIKQLSFKPGGATKEVFPEPH